ncbi:MAG: hypothetical protein WCK36_01295, partial [Candidatus Firestonebacteria bacterium]
MKRSTFLSIGIIVLITFLIVVIKIIFPEEKPGAVKTVLTGKEWLNKEYGSDRMELRGKTTLIVFWSYADINSRKALKNVLAWKEKYGEVLQVAGVYCPEFTFEREAKNIKKPLEGLKITFPVVLDNSGELKLAFMNEVVPSLHLVNKQGRIVYSQKGDGAYDTTEAAVLEALLKANPALSLPEPVQSPLSGVCYPTTPDIYCGASKGAIANKEGIISDKTHNYKPTKLIPLDSLVLTGKYKAAKEYFETESAGAGAALNFTATEVNIVAEASSDEALLEVMFNGKPVKNEIRGKNLDDKSQLKLKGPCLYQL